MSYRITVEGSKGAVEVVLEELYMYRGLEELYQRCKRAAEGSREALESCRGTLDELY
jgi:hypothetical protein